MKIRIKRNKKKVTHGPQRRPNKKIKIRRKRLSTPRTSKQLLALPVSLQTEWNRAVQVASEMRSQGLTLSQASSQLGISPRKVLRLAGSAFRKVGGRYKVKRTDRLLRILAVPSKKGLREIAVRDSREGSLIGRYWGAVEKYLARGDASDMQSLPRKTVKNENGKRIRLLTNLDELRRQGSAGVLRFESIYGRAA